MLVFVVVAAGAVASVQIECEAVGYGPNGWLIVTGYDFHLQPILACVADKNIVSIECEGLIFSELDEELTEWREAA